MTNNITCFWLGLLLYVDTYFKSVTIACYYTTLIGLCHKKVVINIEVWCCYYPPDYQRVTEIDFTLGGPMSFSTFFTNFLPFFIYLCKTFHIFTM